MKKTGFALLVAAHHGQFAKHPNLWGCRDRWPRLRRAGSHRSRTPGNRRSATGRRERRPRLAAIQRTAARTGTGGPVLLIPILMFLNVPVIVAIGISQVVQLPIAVFASVGFSLYGHLDIKMGVMLGLIQAGAVLVGAKMAHYIAADRLRRIVALALIGVGILMTSQVLFQAE